MRNNERKEGFNKQTCDTGIDLYVKISFRWIEHFNARKWKQNGEGFPIYDFKGRNKKDW